MDFDFLPKRRRQGNKVGFQEFDGRRKMPKIHPLLIDHVIENIFDNLPKEHKDLFHSRLVCRQWTHAATNTLRQKSNSIISFGKFRHSAEKMKELTEIVEKNRNFPFTKWKLCQDIFKPEKEELIIEFFEKCGFLIESLMIWLDVESSLVIPPKWIPNLNLDCLKCLIFDDRRRNFEEFGELKLLETILMAAPNVEKLSLIFPTESRFPINRNLNTANSCSEKLVELLDTNHPNKLKELKLDMEMDDKLLLCLSKSFVSLEIIHLCLRTSKFNQESLKLFLESQKLSLRELKFTDLCSGARVTFEFPRLENILKLTIHGWDNSIRNIHLNKMSYKQHMPNLNELSLSTWYPQSGWTQFFPRDDTGALKIKKLKLPQGFDSPELIENISISFLSLTKLEMHYSHDTANVLQAVFKHLKKITDLKLYQSFPGDFNAPNIDHVFTGIPPVLCDKIRHFKRFFMPQNELQRLQARPGLTNLENLITLDMKDLHYQAIITDVTGYYSLLRMKNLKTLIMGRSQIDELCLKKLAEKFPTTMTQQLSSPKVKLNCNAIQTEIPISKCNIF